MLSHRTRRPLSGNDRRRRITRVRVARFVIIPGCQRRAPQIVFPRRAKKRVDVNEANAAKETFRSPTDYYSTAPQPRKPSKVKTLDPDGNTSPASQRPCSRCPRPRYRCPRCRSRSVLVPPPTIRCCRPQTVLRRVNVTGSNEIAELPRSAAGRHPSAVLQRSAAEAGDHFSVSP